MIPGTSRYITGDCNFFVWKSINCMCRKRMIMCGDFCIGFTDFMLKGESLLGYTNLFSSNDFEKNDKIILKYFQ